jgi:hypothetical protein
MLKLSVGDLGFMALGVIAVLGMLLLNTGAQPEPDRADERRSCERFLAQIEHTWSPALVITSIIAAAGAAYVIVAVYAKLH